ncbi:MAG: protein TolR [Candidatus Tectomicrobia bacterium]|nr:protein TolR [Candidatus Tectomicrobia bacterium]
MVSGKQSRMALSDINVTPLVDVMLVLLIIFMITAPMLQQGMDVDLPVASGKPQPSAQDELTLTVTKTGMIYLNQTAYSLTDLRPKLQAMYRDRPDQRLLLRADAAVAYGTVVGVMDVVKQAGIVQLGMITQPETVEP